MKSASAAPSSSILRFLTYNILDGGRGREQALAEIIAAQNTDVILLQEVAEYEFVEDLAEQLGFHFYIAESNSELTLALLTTLTIVKASEFHPPLLRHTCLQATLEFSPGQTVSVYGVHLAAPAFTLPIELYRLRELNLILKYISQQEAEKVIVGGDFNSIAPGDRPDFSGLPFRLRLSILLQGGTIARQVIKKMRAAGFTDAFRVLNPNGRGFTFPAAQPNVRLDYFFVNDALRASLKHCAPVMTPKGVKTASDHLPVLIELELE